MRKERHKGLYKESSVDREEREEDKNVEMTAGSKVKEVSSHKVGGASDEVGGVLQVPIRRRENSKLRDLLKAIESYDRCVYEYMYDLRSLLRIHQFLEIIFIIILAQGVIICCILHYFVLFFYSPCYLFRRASLRPASTDDRSAPILTFSITSLSSQSSSLSATPPDSTHIHSVVTMATNQPTELSTSTSAVLAETNSTRKNPNADYSKDDVFEDLEADAQELRTITRQVAASAIADCADSSDRKEKSEAAATDGGEVGVVPSHWPLPPLGLGWTCQAVMNGWCYKN